MKFGIVFVDLFLVPPTTKCQSCLLGEAVDLVGTLVVFDVL